ncbi:MAG: hypothetical protein AAFN77_08095 [Planctomycetota bacterium]
MISISTTPGNCDQIQSCNWSVGQGYAQPVKIQVHDRLPQTELSDSGSSIVTYQLATSSTRESSTKFDAPKPVAIDVDRPDSNPVSTDKYQANKFQDRFVSDSNPVEIESKPLSNRRVPVPKATEWVDDVYDVPMVKPEVAPNPVHVETPLIDATAEKLFGQIRVAEIESPLATHSANEAIELDFPPSQASQTEGDTSSTATEDDTSECLTPVLPKQDEPVIETDEPLAVELNQFNLLPAPSAKMNEQSRLSAPIQADPVVRRTLEPITASSQIGQSETRVGWSAVITTFEAVKEPKLSRYDERFGLPTSDDVAFQNLPQLTAPAETAEVESKESASSSDRHSSMQLVVYRDDEGRLFLAPPARHKMDIDNRIAPIKTSAGPSPQPKQYYQAPQTMLRLKATTPIGRPQLRPSVANILMRDTVIVDGTHLLELPENKRPQVGEIDPKGNPVIDYQKVRQAIKRLSPTNETLQR